MSELQTEGGLAFSALSPPGKEAQSAQEPVVAVLEGHHWIHTVFISHRLAQLCHPTGQTPTWKDLYTSRVRK